MMPTVAPESPRARDQRLRSHNAEIVGFIDEPVFTCFRQLPAELRIRIWQLSIAPRLIEICDQYDRYDVHVPVGTEYLGVLEDALPNIRYVALCEIQVPAINRVCKESRDIFLKEFFLIGYQHTGGDSAKQGQPVYANPLIDTIFINLALYEDDHGAWIRSFLRNVKRNQGDLRDIKKWGIRSLALHRHTLDQLVEYVEDLTIFEEYVEDLTIFEEYVEDLTIFEEFENLEELVFLEETKGLHVKGRGIIMHPQSKISRTSWEESMRLIGWLKANADKSCKKWADLKVTAAVIEEPGENICITDGRGGLDMLGPPDQLPL